MRTILWLPVLAALCGTTWAQTPPALPVLPRPPSPPEAPATPRPPDLSTPARPALAAPAAGLSVTVEAFTLRGVTRLPDAEVQAVLAPYTGRRLGYAELAQAADAVTTLYRQRGYLLALAYLPEQPVRDGRIEIAVLEGRLGQVTVPAVPGLDGSFLAALAGWRLPPGGVVDEATLLRNLLVLNQLPGLSVGAEVRPGQDVGAADLTLDLRETGPRVFGSAALDSHGSRATGRVRLGGSVTARQWLGRGDAFSAQLLASQNGGQQSAQAGYSLPVHASGTRLGVSLSAVRYQVVDPAFAALQAHGRASELQLSAEQPLLRSLAYGLSLRLAYGRKQLDDRQDATAQRQDRHLDTLQVQLRGDWREPGGAIGFHALGYTAGRVRFDDATSASADAAQRNTGGGYGRINFDLGREQPLGERFSLLARLQLQAAARRNLDAAERGVLGGAHAQRAYGDLSTSADDAATLSLDLRWRLPAELPVTLSAFGDLGRGRVDHKPQAANGDNRLRAGLVGVGVEAALPLDLTLRAAVTRQTLHDAVGERRASRGWLEIIKSF